MTLLRFDNDRQDFDGRADNIVQYPDVLYAQKPIDLATIM